jgi:hypothetical protein
MELVTNNCKKDKQLFIIARTENICLFENLITYNLFKNRIKLIVNRVWF